MNNMKLPFFMRLNKWVYLGLTFVFFAIGFLVIFLSSKFNNNALLWVAVVLFLLGSFNMQAFMSRVVKYKARKEKYPTKEYKYVAELDMVSKLKSDGFEFRKNPFGYIAVKIEGKTCYKVTIVDDVKEYLNPDKDKMDTTETKGINRCNEFVGFEIFTKDEENIFDKAPSLSFEGEKVLYESFLLTDDSIVEANAIDPKEHSYSKMVLMNKLGFEEMVKENNIEEK